MSTESMSNESQNTAGTVATAPVMAASAAPEMETERPAKKRVNRFVLIGVLGVLALAGVLYYVYSQTYETTDDAQVDGHLNPIAARVDGTIMAVHFDDNDLVKAGDTLIELDSADNRVALAQSKAQYDQAQAQVVAVHPNVAITRTSNATDVTTAHAEVANAEAALAAAQHDLDSSLARLQQAKANSDRATADFGRYQILFTKQEVSKSDYDQYRAIADAQAAMAAASEADVASARKVIHLQIRT